MIFFFSLAALLLLFLLRMCVSVWLSFFVFLFCRLITNVSSFQSSNKFSKISEKTTHYGNFVTYLKTTHIIKNEHSQTQKKEERTICLCWQVVRLLITANSTQPNRTEQNWTKRSWVERNEMNWTKKHKTYGWKNKKRKTKTLFPLPFDDARLNILYLFFRLH